MLDKHDGMPLSIQNIDLSKLDNCPWQPPVRTDPRALATLLASVKELGILQPVTLVPNGRRFWIADGHRRCAVAAALNLPDVPAIVHHGEDPRAYWSELNSRTRALKGADWLYAWCQDSSITPPKGTMAEIKRCLAIFNGKATVVTQLVNNNIAPAISGVIDAVHLFLISYSRTYGHVPPTHLEIGMWIVKHRMQTIAQNIMSPTGKGSPSSRALKIVKAIRGDRRVRYNIAA